MEGRGMFLVAKAKEFLCLLFTIFTAALSWLINCGNVTDWVSRTSHSHLTPHTSHLTSAGDKCRPTSSKSPDTGNGLLQHKEDIWMFELIVANIWGKSPHLPRMFLHYSTVQVCERCFSYQDVQTIKTECNHSGIVTVLSSCH